jgi:hypothetical protein
LIGINICRNARDICPMTFDGRQGRAVLQHHYCRDSTMQMNSTMQMKGADGVEPGAA